MHDKFYTLIKTLILLGLFQSCCLATKNTSLGDGFKISEYSVKDLSIMYCFDECCNSGYTVIPQTVVAYNFDKNWIIAKSDSTYHNDKNDFAYWVFKKGVSSDKGNMYDSIKANLLGPLDSLSFFKLLDEKAIKLELTTYEK